MKTFFTATAVATVLCFSLTAHAAQSDDPAAASRRIHADLQFLASDLLEGREAGQRGYDLAALYVKERFRALGLAPGAGDSYLQSVPMREYGLDQTANNAISVHTGDGKVVALGPSEFQISPNVFETSASIEAPLVFVGRGIYSPSLGRDDFADVDVTGKIAVYAIDTDLSLPSEAAAHLRSTAGKQASKRGAVGAIRLYTDAFEQMISFERVKEMWNANSSMKWTDEEGTPYSSSPNFRGGAVLSLDASNRLMQAAGKDFAKTLTAMAEGGVPGFEMGLTASIESHSTHKRVVSDNVVGVLRGSDPELRDEYVVISGHLDHLGIKAGHSDENDQIYNGAMDNASGIATMLEIARALAADPPKRSVIFLAVTAEEKGLVGSDYYAKNPTVDRSAIVANVNLDMPILSGDFKDLVAFGASHSSLETIARDTLKAQGLTLTPDPQPEQAFFVRSDQYSFVKQGVPAVYLDIGPGDDEGAAAIAFQDAHYHQPSDEVQHIDLDAAAKFARVNHALIRAIADSAQRPQWNADSFFATLFSDD